jgi:hypothetical protein
MKPVSKKSSRRFVAIVACLVLPVSVASPQSRKPTTISAPRWLAQIKAQSDFDLLARVYYRGRFYALPHVMFVIDRRAHGRVYYVNSKTYQFHKDFLNASYLSLERGRALYDNNYSKADRRFLLDGRISDDGRQIHFRVLGERQPYHSC